jgi:hypothetical protein
MNENSENDRQDFAAIKKGLKKMREKTRRKHADDKKSDGTLKNIFECDLDATKKDIDPELSQQINPMIETAHENFKEYQKHLLRVKELEADGIMAWKIRKEVELTYKEKEELISNLNTSPGSFEEEEVLRSSKVWRKVNEIDRKTSEWMNQLMSQKNTNLKLVTKTMRKISTMHLILTSPLLRYELRDMFDLWIAKHRSIVFNTFAVSGKNKPEEYTLIERIVTGTQMEDDSSMKNEEDPSPDDYNSMMFSSPIYIGGTMKHMVGLWTAEECFEALIVTYYWLIGKLRVHEDGDSWVLDGEIMDYDYSGEYDDLKQQCLTEFDEKKSFISIECATEIFHIIHDWITKAKDLRREFSKDRESINHTMLKGFDCEKMLDVRRNLVELSKKISTFVLLRDVAEVNDDSIVIKKEDIGCLLDSENNFLNNNPVHSDPQTRQYYQGAEQYNWVSPSEVKSSDYEYWLLANLLSSAYVPLVMVVTHLTNSVFDNHIDCCLRSRRQETPLQLVKEFTTKHQRMEIEFELTAFLDLASKNQPQEYRTLLKLVQESDYKAFYETVIELLKLEALNPINRPDYFPTGAPSNNPPEVKKLFKDLENVLTNRCSIPNCTEYLSALIKDERFVQFSQRVEISDFITSSSVPLLEDISKRLKLGESECEAGIITKQSLKTVDETELFMVDKNLFQDRTVFSKDAYKFFSKVIQGMLDLHPIVIVKKNATASADRLYEELKQALKDLHRENKNEKVSEDFRITRIKKKYSFPRNEKMDKVKSIRRFMPEAKRPKEERAVPDHVWDKAWKYISESYWKVQVGFITWYALLVDEAPYEEAVRRILDKAEFDKFSSRDAATKAMGIISEHFKLFSEPNYSTKNDELLKVPSWVFSGADTIFGYTDPCEMESKNWKEDVLKGIVDWVGSFEPENFEGLSLNYDFEISMTHFMKEFKQTYSTQNLSYFFYKSNLLSIPSPLKQTFAPKSKPIGDREIDPKNYLNLEDEKGMVLMNDYFSWCKSFLRFSVDGAAQGLKVSLDKLLIVADDEEENTLENTQTLKELESKKSDETKVPSSETHEDDMNEAPTERGLTELEVEEVKKKALQKLIDSKKIGREVVVEETNAKTKSLSKTLAFAYGGKNISRLLFWTGGWNYVPDITCHLKIEQKKIRLVANSDLVSFSKQNYFYSWVEKALPDSARELIWSYIHPRDKVVRAERINQCFTGEKWMCPMDLKDFQIQFGPTHHHTFFRCLWRQLENIKDDEIRKELTYLTSSIKDDMSKGCMMLRLRSNEDFNATKQALPENKKQFITTWECKEINKMKDEEHEDAFESDDPDSEPKEKEEKEFRVTAAFEVKNGIISGWKMTSMLNSIYNYSTNHMIDFWSLHLFGTVPTDYATMGDDTHFKTRFLLSSLFHISFTNAIGKVAHPKKQFASTRFTEFLKKTYDTWQKNINYQPCRIISSMLYEKENRGSKSNNINQMKDIIDLWNIFLVRLPDKKRRDTIVSKRILEMFLRSRFKWTPNKDYEGYSLEQVNQMISAPGNINGALTGPTTNTVHYFKQLEGGEWTFPEKYLRAVMLDYHKEFSHGLQIKKWHGIKSYASSILRRLSTNKTKSFTQDQALKNKLEVSIFESVGESLQEYKRPDGPQGKFEDVVMSEHAQKYLEMIRAKKDWIYKLIKGFLVDYIQGKEIKTAYGQLMVLNNKFSRGIERELRNTPGLSPYDIFMIMSSFSPSCKLTPQLFNEMASKMEIKLIFDQSLNRDFGVSISRYIHHDELLGALSLIISESICHILIGFDLNGKNYEYEDQKEFLQVLILFLEIELFRGLAMEIVELIRDTSTEKLLAAPF